MPTEIPTQTFIVNGTEVSVEVEDDVRLLWVLRNLLGITGPNTAGPRHLQGVYQPPERQGLQSLRHAGRRVVAHRRGHRHRGPGRHVDTELHPVQEAWTTTSPSAATASRPDHGGRALIEEVFASGRRTVTDADLDGLHNICRCGTYPRIREAIHAQAATMAGQPVSIRSTTETG